MLFSEMPFPLSSTDSNGVLSMSSDKIAVIGDRDTVMGFQMTGVRMCTVATTPDETLSALIDYYRDPQVGLIIITEPLAKSVEQKILEISEFPVPVILLIPDRNGSTGEYERLLRELVRKAVGIDIKI